MKDNTWEREKDQGRVCAGVYVEKGKDFLKQDLKKHYIRSKVNEFNHI